MDGQARGAAGSQHAPASWLSWYFAPRLGLLLTVPLFALLVAALVMSALSSLAQCYALLKLLYAHWGVAGIVVMVAGGWIPFLLPPALYYSLLKNTPGPWLRNDLSVAAKLFATLVALVLFSLLAYFISRGLGWAISWVADLDPCTAFFEAGVTGTVRPADCS